MKNIFVYSLLGVLLMVLSASCEKHEKILICGFSWNKLAIIDKESNEIEWIHELKKEDDGCNDIEFTKSGDILFAYEGGARLINRDHEVLWDFRVEKGQELYTATELPSGEFMLGICANPSRIVTLRSNGEFLKEQNFDTGIKNVHGQFRQIFPTKNKTYIIPLMNKGEVIELDQNSEVLRTIAVGGNPFSARELNDGNWLVACGDGHKIVIADPKSESIMQTIDDQDIQDHNLLFVAETQLSNKGTYMFANWNGHSQDKSQAKLIEIDSNKNVVWTLAPSEQISNLSAFYIFKE